MLEEVFRSKETCVATFENNRMQGEILTLGVQGVSPVPELSPGVLKGT